MLSLLSVSGVVFDKMPRPWEELKALHFQVNKGLIDVYFSDTVNFVKMEVCQLSSDPPFNDLVGFLRCDLINSTRFSSDDDYFSITKVISKYKVPIFNELVPMDTIRFDYAASRNQIIDDSTYVPFSEYSTSVLKEILDNFVPLTSMKSSTKGHKSCNSLLFIDECIYLICEDTSVLVYSIKGKSKFPNCCVKAKFLRTLQKLLYRCSDKSVDINISDKRLQVVGSGFTISTSLIPTKIGFTQKVNEILDTVDSSEFVQIKASMMLDISYYTNSLKYTDYHMYINFNAQGKLICTPKRLSGMPYKTNFVISGEGCDSDFLLEEPLLVKTHTVQRLLPALKKTYDICLLLCPQKYVLIKSDNHYIILSNSKHEVIPRAYLP
jgi:glutaredoxin-related protein